MTLALVACGEASNGDGDSTTGSTTTSTGDAPATSSGGGDTSGTPSTSGGEASGDSSGAPAETSSAEATSDPTADPTTGDDTGAPACPDEPLPPGDHTIEVQHDGYARSAILHVPPGVDGTAPAPLVFNFHGFTSNAGQQVLFSGMNTLADAEGFLVVYPDGINSSWNAGACCGDAMSQNIDDVGFVRALHAELTTRACVDARRVYSTGMSNGGFISNRLACEAADLFAAIGPVSAVNGMDACSPSRPVPVIAFNGTADILVPYDGGGFISVAESFAGWAERDGCPGAPAPDMAAGAASSETYARCSDGAQVTQWTLEGMGHCWPGNPLCPFGAASTDIDANGEMWAFFEQFALP